jgi:hypothetical protein
MVVKDQGVMMVGVGKSVSYISFIGGMFGFGQIKEEPGPRLVIVHMNMRDGSKQPAGPKSPAQRNTRNILHSSVTISLGHELKLVAQFVR